MKSEATDKLRRVFAKQLESIERMRPLCPDHRDKQVDKGCLACRIERLEKTLQKVLECFPKQEIIDAIEPDDKTFSRKYGSHHHPTGKQLREWRKLLE